jgi:hypothetical protein
VEWREAQGDEPHCHHLAGEPTGGSDVIRSELPTFVVCSRLHSFIAAPFHYQVE